MVQSGNGFAIASLVLGIVAVVLGLFPLLRLLSILVLPPCAVLGFIFGIVGIVQGRKVGKGVIISIVGILLSLIAVALLLAPIFEFLNFLSMFQMS
jgi:ABC-type transport system involved in cytochrome c biogenesis permease subunit